MRSNGAGGRRLSAEEQRSRRLAREYIEAHPAWPWLAGVRGLGYVLAARLLERLDVARAPHPSSFWAYCGLATVPGVMYACDRCGARVERPADRRVSAGHRAPDGSPCAGALRSVTDDGPRIAQPRPRRGESSPYDRDAKVICYLIGASLVRRGGAYRAYYARELARLEDERPDWPERRRHLTAQRKTVKLFLTHLWLVWREALGLPLTRPHAPDAGRAAPPSSPWAMVEGTARLRAATASRTPHPRP